MARKKKEIVNITKEDKKTKERYGKDSHGRIIKLEDGKILSNEENSDNNELDLRMDNKIYLKDYKIQDNIQNGSYRNT